jgi:hypothetical protein
VEVERIFRRTFSRDPLCWQCVCVLVLEFGVGFGVGFGVVVFNSNSTSNYLTPICNLHSAQSFLIVMKFVLLTAISVWLPTLARGFTIPAAATVTSVTAVPHSTRTLFAGVNGVNGDATTTATKKVIVLGGDGFCGWPTSLYLSDQGHNVVIVDNLSRRNIDIELGCDSLTPIQSMDVRCVIYIYLYTHIYTKKGTLIPIASSHSFILYSIPRLESKHGRKSRERT